jgi:hypothetical protein
MRLNIGSSPYRPGSAPLLEAGGVAFIGANGGVMGIVFAAASIWLLLLLACAYSRGKDQRERRR